MKIVRFANLCWILLSLVACNPAERLDQMAEELMDADRAFSALSAREGMNVAFTTFCAEDGVLLRPSSLPIEGKSAVKELISQTDDSGFVLTWEPHHGQVARSGDLGYTYGVFTMKAKESEQVQQGTYVSVWVRENGEWRWVLDTGNQGIASEDQSQAPD